MQAIVTVTDDADIQTLTYPMHAVSRLGDTESLATAVPTLLSLVGERGTYHVGDGRSYTGSVSEVRKVRDDMPSASWELTFQADGTDGAPDGIQFHIAFPESGSCMPGLLLNTEDEERIIITPFASRHYLEVSLTGS